MFVFMNEQKPFSFIIRFYKIIFIYLHCTFNLLHMCVFVYCFCVYLKEFYHNCFKRNMKNVLYSP